MKHLLTFHMRRDALPNAEKNEKCFREMMQFVSELKASGSLIFDSQILPNPAPLRIIHDQVEENPPEILGGFFIIETADHEAALELARRCPHNQVGPVGLHTLNETDENAYSPDA